MLACVVVASCLALACAGSSGAGGASNGDEADLEPIEPTTEWDPAEAPLRHFSFVSLDGERITHASLRGRLTIIGLAATYDVPSQAQARFISGLVHRHVPRINALLVVLEPPDNRPLVEAFVSSLNLRFPVVMADDETIAGRGPFPKLHHVPSVLILDREGREVWRHIGLVGEQDLVDALERHER